MWKDSLFRGFSYIAESGSIWRVGDAFSIIPREQYPRRVKVFFCSIDRVFVAKWEALFYGRFIYAIFVFLGSPLV